LTYAADAPAQSQSYPTDLRSLWTHCTSETHPCAVPFPGAQTKKTGKTTWYNQQSSVEAVLRFGFGLDPSADFPLDAAMICGLVAQAIGRKADTPGLVTDGACSGAAIAADADEPTQYIAAACSWASDLLEKLAKPVGVLASLGCTLAPSSGHSLGGVFESKHELDVAVDVIDRGRCLKYSPTHFGSPWLAIECSRNDPGVSTRGANAASWPSAQKVFAAWRASLGIDGAVPGTVKGFGTPQCWRNWVPADLIGQWNLPVQSDARSAWRFGSRDAGFR
jgi:hypothetical protein